MSSDGADRFGEATVGGTHNYGTGERVRRYLRTTDRLQGGAVSGKRGGGVRVWLASATERRAQKRDDLVFVLAELAPQVRKLPGRAGVEVASYMDMIRLEILQNMQGEE